MPTSFFVVSFIVFCIIAFFLYWAASAYASKEVSKKEWKRDIGFLSVLRAVLPLSLVGAVLVMLAVRYFFY